MEEGWRRDKGERGVMRDAFPCSVVSSKALLVSRDE